MKAEIISVGTELLLGHTVNTDAAHVARELAAFGIDLEHVQTVGDNAGRL
ncbi:MAG: competence/damage-inducible protein A, partial [Desulfovibrio sp.]|nr:competence/damage-inducible protein A [Desulfovibrio sp.]